MLTETSPAATFYITGGTLSADASSYVTRQADTDLYAGLLASEYCYILNSRQMGKSSLCVRTIERLKTAGVKTVFLDLTKFGGRNLTAEQWYAALLSEVGRELGLRKEFVAYWKENDALPPLTRFFGAVRDLALPASDAPLVVFIDEIDVTRSLPFSADEFFAAVRECYVGRAANSALRRLTFCLLGTATPADLIQDTRVSPFNIGKRIELRDFTPQEAAPLAAGLGDRNSQLLTFNLQLLPRILYWTHGHPYLTQRLCRACVENKAGTNTEVDSLCAGLFLTHTAKESDDNLAFVRSRLLKSEVDVAALLDVYDKLRQGKRISDDETNPLTSLLKLSGVARVEDGLLRVRNRIYARVFDRAWVIRHMPDAERRRQQEAYRKGLGRALSISSAIFLIIGFLAVSAYRNARRANTNAKLALQREKEALANADRANANLYLADMSLIQSHWDSARLDLVHTLLKETEQSRNRNFEWGYWNRLCHLSLRDLPNTGPPVAYSPDGSRIFTNDNTPETGTAKIWDARTGRELVRLKGKAVGFNSVAFYPDGSRLVTGGKDVILWNARTGRRLMRLIGHTAPTRGVSVSPDGHYLATVSQDLTARLWDARTGRAVRTLKGHTNWLLCVAFSPDSTRLATGSSDQTVKLWDVATGRQIRTFREQDHAVAAVYSAVTAVCFSPDGKRLLTSSNREAAAYIWDVETGRPLKKLTGHTNNVEAVAWSRDGKRLATGSRDTTVRIWDAQTGQPLFENKGHIEGVTSVAFAPDSRHLVSGDSGAVAKIWDVAEDYQTITFRAHHASVTAVALFSDDRRAVTGDGRGTIYIWDVATRRILQTCRGSDSIVESLAVSPDGRQFAASYYRDAKTRIWDANNGKLLRTLNGHKEPVMAVAYAPDGRHLVTVSLDKTAIVWDVSTGQKWKMLQVTGRIGSVAFFPDGHRIAVGQDDHSVTIWDLQTDRTALLKDIHSDAVQYVAVSPEGKRLLTCSWDNTVRVWDLMKAWNALSRPAHPEGGSTVRQDSANLHNNGTELLVENTHDIIAVAFFPDGKRLLTGSWDRTAKIMDANTGRILLTLTGHTAEITGVAIARNGQFLLTGSRDGTARIWMTDTANIPISPP